MQHMDKQGLAVQTSNKCNFFHLLCSRGYEECVKYVLSVFDQGKLPGLDKDFMLMLLNSKDKAGRGCVDQALMCKTPLAIALKQFGAKEQRMPPPKPDKGIANNAWKWGASKQQGDGDGDGWGAQASGWGKWSSGSDWWASGSDWWASGRDNADWGQTAFATQRRTSRSWAI